MTKLKIKKADYMLVLAILVLGIAGFWFNIQGVGAEEQKYASVYVQNEQVAELSLSSGDQFSYTFNFGSQDQYTAHLEVEDGRIRMQTLDEDICPKHICSHTGWIEYSYEKIVCLPNQIMITFNESTRGSDSEEVDGVTY